jgi:hypothetical protein
MHLTDSPTFTTCITDSSCTFHPNTTQPVARATTHTCSTTVTSTNLQPAAITAQPTACATQPTITGSHARPVECPDSIPQRTRCRRHPAEWQTDDLGFMGSVLRV